MRSFVHTERSGISLVIVLGSVALLSTLVVAFLVQMDTELRASRMVAQEATSRILAQSASNIVISQIKAGTKGVDGAGDTLAWASQPGMIRSFDETGALDQVFKLYSDSNMVIDDTFDPASAVPPADWATKRALYTNLNQPVQVDGTYFFPIIDGNGVKSLTKIAGGTTVPAYLGYDSNTDTLPDVDGFSIDPTKVSYNPSNPVSGTNDPVPMPVKWLYVLENGEIVAPSAGTDNNTVVVNGSLDSPIIGRIAFWTDDDSCKLNINTASEGSYWDIPRFNSNPEWLLAEKQPVQNEYQRYPGHPATNSISTVLKGFTGNESIYDVIPRVVPGGSKSGTVRTTMTAIPTMAPLPVDGDRLYASVDELLFKQPQATDTTRLPNQATILDKTALQRSKFFLTTSSRAPDVNLFNLPRISMWPVRLPDTTKVVRTPYDELIAFCTTVGGHFFHFQRSNAYSQNADLPSTLPADKSEETGLKRNTRLLHYFRGLMTRAVPGFGPATFEAKYPQDADQIATEIFDYVRSTNLKDTSTPGDASTPGVVPYTNDTKMELPSGLLKPLGGGIAVPITGPSNTRGFGRFPTVQGGLLHFIADDSTGTYSPPPAGIVRVEAGFFVQLFDPSLGFPDAIPNYKIRVSKLNGFRWGENSSSMTSMGFPATGELSWVGFLANQERYWGGTIGYSQFSRGKSNYPLISTRIDLPKPDPNASTTFQFQGGDVDIELLDPSGNVVQTVTLNFPDATFPCPKVVTPAVTAGQWESRVNWRRFLGSYGSSSTGHSGRLLCGTSTNDSIWIKPNNTDVVRQICSVTDFRVIAPRKTVSPADNFYAPHPEYSDSTKYLAHSLGYGNGGSQTGATRGTLVNKTSAASAPGTDLPPTIEGVALGKSTSPPSASDLPGDWDNAFGYLRDGGYINKADEGERGTNNGTNSELPYFPFDGAGALNRALGATYFSANRMIPSPGVFGSLPTGVWSNRPWQTLLFRPGPAGHPGLTAPRDHLLLDLFHMPVVEPYAISEPLSTAGRINMNYQIIPFIYITRNTGIQSVLKAEKVITVPNNAPSIYKAKDKNGTWNYTNYRFPVNIQETVLGFKARFDNGQIFKSASEICELPIVPNDTGSSLDTYASMSTSEAYWNTRLLTGDNSRERPYTTIYPRLTTKSNTFTIHMRVQALKKVRNTTPGVWIEGKDQVMGEYRGSQTIERYVDPNNSALRDYDYADLTVTKPISDFYRFRVLDSKQFSP